VTWIIAATVARTIGLRVSPAEENDLDRTQEALSAYAFGRPDGGFQPVNHDTVRPGLPPVDGAMKLIRALVDYEDLDELRAALVEAGAVQIVLSEASLYTSAPRTGVFRGQRRRVTFDPRLQLEVTVPKFDLECVVQAIQRFPGISPYLQVIDAGFAAAGGGSHGRDGTGEHSQGGQPVPGEAPTRPGPPSAAGGD
jgi:nitrogen regulatory protein PII